MFVINKNSQFLYKQLFKKENVFYNYILIICVNKTVFINDVRCLQNNYNLKSIKFDNNKTEHDWFSVFEENDTGNLLMITTLFNVILNNKLKQYENILFRNPYENITVNENLLYNPIINSVNKKLIKHIKLYEHIHCYNNEIYRYKPVKSLYTILLTDTKSTGIGCVACGLKITGKLIKLQLNQGDNFQNYCYFCSTHTKHRNYTRNVIQNITNETSDDVYNSHKLWAMFYKFRDDVTIYTMAISNRSYVEVYHSLGNFIASNNKLALIKFKLNNPHSTERLIYFSCDSSLSWSATNVRRHAN